MSAPSLTDPGTLLDPYPALGWLRENDPVHWSADVSAWVVTRHADVVAAFREPRLSADRATVMARAFLGGGDTAPVADFLRVNADMMLNKDGADHHRLRVLGNRGFTPSALAAWAPKVQRVIDGLLATAGDRFDLVADLAEPMPATVIAEMFGLPAADHHKFRQWADDVARFFGGTVRDVQADALAANTACRELDAYFLNLYAARRAAPGDDLMSLFLAGEEAGRLTPGEVVMQCILILIAGHVTTIDQLSNGVYALLRHEGQWARLAAAPELVKPAVEEMIRFDPAVTLVMRVATGDLTIGGRAVRAGQLVFLAVAAANRDPAVFPEADTFDVARSPNRHVGFGVAHHQCLGMNLARIELESALKALLVRYPRLRLDPDRLPVRKCESLTFRGFARLPVRAD
jgi:cytochrome P450